LLGNISFLFSRGAYLAYFFAVTAIVLATKNRKMILIGILLCCFVGLIFLRMTTMRMRAERMDVVNMSDAGRISAMYAGFNMWRSSPLLGIGHGTSMYRLREFEEISILGFSNETMSIHNIYVQLLAETGLLGFLLYNTFTIMLLLALIRRFRGKKNLVKECPYELFYVISICVFNITGLLYPLINEGFYWYLSVGTIVLLRDSDVKKGEKNDQ
jgi:O-antigen ligase